MSQAFFAGTWVKALSGIVQGGQGGQNDNKKQ